MGAFTDRIETLIPSAYLAGDESGDLQAVLTTCLTEYDEIKVLADDMPRCFDFENCDPFWLDYFAVLLGPTYNIYWSVERKRSAIRDAVSVAKRRGTTQSLREQLLLAGWEGSIQDAGGNAFITNRSWLNNGVLGDVSGTPGSFTITVTNGLYLTDVRRVVAEHQPAGTKAWYSYWHGMRVDGADPGAVWMALGLGDETFTDPRVPPAISNGQSSLIAEYARIAHTRKAYVVEDLDGSIVVDGVHYMEAETSDLVAYFFVFDYPKSLMTVKEIGFFGGDVTYRSDADGNLALYGTYASDNLSGQVSDPGTMIAAKNIQTLVKSDSVKINGVLIVDTTGT